MKKWFVKMLQSKKSCKVLGHVWERSSLRYNRCVYCGLKTRRGGRGVKSD